MRRKEEEDRNREKVEQEYREKCLSLAKIHPRDAPIRYVSPLHVRWTTKDEPSGENSLPAARRCFTKGWAGNKMKFGTERAPKASHEPRPRCHVE